MATRALWKWACRESGRAAATAGLSTEAAVYGAMCGDADLMLPLARHDWEAAAWVRFRRCDCFTSRVTTLPATQTPSKHHPNTTRPHAMRVCQRCGKDGSFRPSVARCLSSELREVP